MSKKKAMTQTKISGKQPARHKTAKKGVKVLVKHIPIYGLKIGTRNALTSDIETVAYRFCSVFGREKSTTGSNAPIDTTKFFNCFCTDLYEKHMAGQHPAKWSSYKGLQSSKEREAFFQVVEVPYVERLEAAFESDDTLVFTVSTGIVEVVIGRLLFHPDKEDGVSIRRAMACFAREGNMYKVTVKLEGVLHCKQWKRLSSLAL